MESTKLTIINEANKIFYALSTNEELISANSETRYEFIQDQHKEFTSSFPLVCTYMAEGKYDKDAFNKLLNKIEITRANQENKYKTPSEKETMMKMVESQADYSKYMYMIACKKSGMRYNSKRAKEIWEADCRRLYASYKSVKDDYDELESELKEEEAKNNEERKKELAEFVNYRSQKEGAEEIDEENLDDYLSYMNGLIKQFDDDDINDLSVQKNTHKEIQEKVKEFEDLEKSSRPQLSKEEVSASFLAGTSTEAFFKKKNRNNRRNRKNNRNKKGKNKKNRRRR